VQIRRVQRRARRSQARHQDADLRKRALGFLSEVLDGAPHEAQVRASVARFILRNEAVDVLDDRLRVPLGRVDTNR
jgi:hypothetical protein